MESRFGYVIGQDANGLKITLLVKGEVHRLRGHDRDEFLAMMELLLAEYEQRALALDLEEGNHA